MDKRPLILGILALLQFCTCGQRIHSIAGPYRVISRCPLRNDSGLFNATGTWWVNVRYTHARGRQRQYAWGTCHTENYFDDRLKAHIVIDLWSNGQWVKNYYPISVSRACSTGLQYYRPMLDFYFGEDVKKGCPVKKGHRTIRNRAIDIKFKDVEVFRYGRYRYTIAIENAGQILGSFTGEVDVVPRV